MKFTKQFAILELIISTLIIIKVIIILCRNYELFISIAYW